MTHYKERLYFLITMLYHVPNDFAHDNDEALKNAITSHFKPSHQALGVHNALPLIPHMHLGTFLPFGSKNCRLRVR